MGGRGTMGLTALVLLSACVQVAVSGGCGCQQMQRREFDTKYTDDVGENCKKCFTFVYNYFVEQNWTTRICVRTPNPGPTPLLVVARQSANSIAFAVPLSIKGDSSQFPSVCRTLCPISRSGNTTFMNGTAQRVVLDFWSKSPSHFEFELQRLDNFAIGTQEPVTLNLTVSHPAVLQYSMPDDLSTVRVEANSDTSECMLLSVEDIECPFHDTHETVQEGGYRQTHTKKSAITVKRGSIYNELYIVLLLNPDDSECKDDIITGIPEKDRFKQVTVEVIPVLYEWVNYAVLVPFFVILIFGILCCICYHCQICVKIFPEIQATPSTITSDDEKKFAKKFYVMADMAEQKPWSSKSYQYAWNLGVIAIFYALPAIQLVYISQLFMHTSGNLDECYYNFRCAHQMELGQWVISDFNHVFSNVGYIILGLTFIAIVKSRESKDPKSAGNKKKAGLHMALQRRNDPANQDVQDAPPSDTRVGTGGNQQSRNQDGGAEDNASRPPKRPSKTKVGTGGNQQNRNQDGGAEDNASRPPKRPSKTKVGTGGNQQNRNQDGGAADKASGPLMPSGNTSGSNDSSTVVYIVNEAETGIPPHYGLFYTMGWALCMEGVMSLTYHICPKKSNFQFDTTFMYVICMVCIAQLYYARHQAIAPRAYSFWMMLAISIFLPFLGLFSKVVFWLLYVIWIMCLLFMTFKYLVKPGAFPWFRKAGLMHCMSNVPLRKSYVESKFRDVSMGLAIVVQLAVLIGLGVIDVDFNTIILAFYIINVVWYCIYYLRMKNVDIKVGETLLENFSEKVPWTSKVFFSFFLLNLPGSIYFYYKNCAEWNKTPAESRERNVHCLSGFDYYDNHDIWHFLSSFCIFFLYLFLLTVDDDLKEKNMSHIVVF